MKALYTLLIFLIPFVGFGQCVEGDCKNGKGTYKYATGPGKGDDYVGEWKNGKRNGIGTYTDVSGHHYQGSCTYVGEWKNDLFHGQGTYIWDVGAKYVGEFKNGLFDGQGTFARINGAKYVGEFKKGTFNGKGTYTFADGTVNMGLWKNGELIVDK